MSLDALFDAVRRPVFGGRMSQSQVDGVERLLRHATKNGIVDLRHAAYGLATGAWETGRKMQPLEEYGRGAGRPYGRPDPKTGERYFGRGDVQLTWIDNYRQFGPIVGADLVNNPELALDPEISADVLWVGMRDGLFRKGHSLARYFPDHGPGDPIMARLIVNGIPKGKKLPDRATEIAGYYDAFLTGLTAAGWPELAGFDPEPAGEPAGRPGGHPTGRHREGAPRGSAPGKNAVQKPHGQASGSIEAVQRRLKAMGYHEVGEIDGKWGGRTAGAIAAFMNDRNLDGEPVITPAFLAELDEAEGEHFERPIAKERKEAQAPDVAPKLPTVNDSWWSQLWAGLGAFGAMIAAAFKGIFGDADGDGTPDIVSTVHDVFEQIPGEITWGAIGVLLIVIWWKSRQAKIAAVKAYQEGRLT